MKNAAVRSYVEIREILLFLEGFRLISVFPNFFERLKKIDSIALKTLIYYSRGTYEINFSFILLL